MTSFKVTVLIALSHKRFNLKLKIPFSTFWKRYQMAWCVFAPSTLLPHWNVKLQHNLKFSFGAVGKCFATYLGLSYIVILFLYCSYIVVVEKVILTGSGWHMYLDIAVQSSLLILVYFSLITPLSADDQSSIVTSHPEPVDVRFRRQTLYNTFRPEA